jgi:hypothetical protein
MGQNNPYRSSSDSNKSHERTRAAGHSGGNAGAGKSGGEDMGSEKKIDDERFGSSKPNHSEPWKDEGKKDAPGKNDESYKRTNDRQ